MKRSEYHPGMFSLFRMILIAIDFFHFFWCRFASRYKPHLRFCAKKGRRGYWPQNLNYFSHCRDFIQFRKYTGLSGSTKVRFFLHRFSRKIGISTGIEVVFGALFDCGCVACFLMFFFFFLVNCRYKSNGPKNVTFQFFVGPFLMISKSTFWCLQ